MNNSNEVWNRRKAYLLRTLFEDNPRLSPIPEAQEPIANTESSESLPDLIVEVIPKRIDLDETDDFYDKLEKYMLDLIKSDRERDARNETIDNDNESYSYSEGLQEISLTGDASEKYSTEGMGSISDARSTVAVVDSLSENENSHESSVSDTPSDHTLNLCSVAINNEKASDINLEGLQELSPTGDASEKHSTEDLYSISDARSTDAEVDSLCKNENSHESSVSDTPNDHTLNLCSVAINNEKASDINLEGLQELSPTGDASEKHSTEDLYSISDARSTDAEVDSLCKNENSHESSVPDALSDHDLNPCSVAIDNEKAPDINLEGLQELSPTGDASEKYSTEDLRSISDARSTDAVVDSFTQIEASRESSHAASDALSDHTLSSGAMETSSNNHLQLASKEDAGEIGEDGVSPLSPEVMRRRESASELRTSEVHKTTSADPSTPSPRPPSFVASEISTQSINSLSIERSTPKQSRTHKERKRPRENLSTPQIKRTKTTQTSFTDAGDHHQRNNHNLIININNNCDCLWRNFSLGIPTMYKLCKCREHMCD